MARDEFKFSEGVGDPAQALRGSPDAGLKRNVQIAFAGHNRPEDLGDKDQILGQLRHAFALLKAANVSEARLLTGLASGSDDLAAQAWREAGLGPVHAVLPYLDFESSIAIGPGALAESATWLDGEAAAASGRNAHLKQTRMIVEAADMVAVVWSGEPARGAGGTADAVLSALHLGLPVLWMRPGDPDTLRLIRPENLPSDFHFPEFQEALARGDLRHVQDATPERIHEALAHAEFLPLPEVERLEAHREVLDRLMHGSLWKSYRWLRDLLGGRVHFHAPDVKTPESLAAQPGFKILSEAYALADEVANKLAAVHRSEQVLLILAMILAAFVGSAWTLWPGFKVTGVAIELLLSLLGLFVWAAAADARQNERWGEFRFLAERLRLERASWAIGIGMARGSERPQGGEASVWRQVRRDAGLPHGPFDAERARTWGAWSLNELVEGQAAYHRAVGRRDARFAHRLQRIETVTFLWFFALFTFYLAAYVLGRYHYLPHEMTGLIAMTGSVVPALATAIMALEAKLEPEEQSERSRRIADALDALQARLGADTTLEGMQTIARAAIALHVSESGSWQEGINRRRLFRA